jgi:hypothetical protein
MAFRNGPIVLTVVVTLNIDDGYHINANPPLLDYLIPTSIAFDGIEPSAIDYLKRARFTSAFAPQRLDVYQGTAILVAHFLEGSLGGRTSIRGTVAAQACNHEICLPPSNLPLSVSTTGR